MMVPTIHLNGTSHYELLAQHCTALDAIDRAIGAVQKAAPNGRDFYPQGQDAILTAIREHKSRLDRLQVLRKEVYDLAFAINEAAP